jgi:hypothetical protein
LDYFYYFFNGHIPSVWYFGSDSVADAFNLRQYKADFFQGENREIHRSDSTHPSYHLDIPPVVFFSLVAIQANPKKSYSSLLCGLGVFGVVNQKLNIGIFFSN